MDAMSRSETPMVTRPLRLPASGDRRRGTALVVTALVLTAAGTAGLAAYGTGYGYRAVGSEETAAATDLPSDAKALKQMQNKLRSQQRQLVAALERKAPRGVYIVIDQTQNRLYLMEDEKAVREAVCSAGSGLILQEQEGGKRQWIFDTPRGVHRVRSKIEDPVWKKPDWAFVEEGKPIPTNPEERFAPGELGEYALYFGNGYMIHGTLYERLLGRSVTHGCIRLGREDLREVYRAADIGTPIYIY
jgi:L,D-transpeptidase YbiS